MKYVEAAGLVKFDFLGLKTMTVIQKAVDLINHKGESLDILKVPLDDKKTYELLTSGQTVGVFQLESAGMRDTLRKMKPNRFGDIIALVALYRPGPMDNIPVYIDVKEGRQEPDYMHPKLKPYLEETYGIMVYQEQVMQAAQVLSGYTLGGADLLRRAMGKKIQAEMDAQRQKFIEGAVEHSQISPERASEIFDQIDKFAGYGFNKSHAAAYALIAYWTGWLKANYPLEFMAASMTLDMGNTDKLAIFKQDLDKMGIALLPPDINRSFVEFAVEGNSIRYALAALKGVGAQAMEKVVAERTAKGLFKDLGDFIGRMDQGTMNRRQLEQLTCAGAFDSFAVKRSQVYGACDILMRHAQSLAAERAVGQTSLFGGEGGQQAAMPDLPKVEDWDQLEQLRHEFEAVGFYLSAHPLDSRMDQLKRMKILTFAEVEDMMTQQAGAYVTMAGVLLKKQIRVSQKSGNKFAFLQMSDSSGVYEVALFSEVLARTKDVLNEGDTLLIKAMAEQQEEQIRLTVQDVQPLDKTLSSKITAIHVTLNGMAAVEKLKTLLTAEGRGPAQVFVHVPISEKEQAILTLPGRYSFSPQARSLLSKTEGIREIREV
jgi:DNA polymerase-3 subunit alpha